MRPFAVISVGILLALVIPILLPGIRYLPVPDAWQERFVASEMKRYWFPHVMPRHRDATGLRIAMVHDVIHQRYPSAGSDYHRARLATAEAALAQSRQERGEAPPSLAELALIDDLAVAHDRLDDPRAGLAVLTEQRAALVEHHGPAPADPATVDHATAVTEALLATTIPELDERELAWYRSFANTGTLLVHAHLGAALRGEEAAEEAVQRGLGELAAALQVNPHAHFGREAWQVVAVHNLLASSEREPGTELSLFGLPLEEIGDYQSQYGEPWSIQGRSSSRHRLLVGEPIPTQMDDPRATRAIPGFLGWTDGEGLLAASEAIREVGFDQSVLACIGMWTQGGGPNPHLALELAINMELIGQRHLAWKAYQRALDMGERFHPDAERAGVFRTFCRVRQRNIAEDLVEDGHFAGVDVAERDLRERYAAELAYGQEYQAAQAAFASVRLADGADPLAPGFFSDFFAEHGMPASDPGLADTYRRAPSGARRRAGLWFWGMVLSLAFGVSMLAWALWRRRTLA